MKNTLVVLFAGALLTLAGCGGVARPATVPVTGKLTVDGKPYGPATLTLSPETPSTDPKQPKPGATGKVAADGTIEYYAFNDTKGAVPGKYTVTLGKVDATSFDPVPATKPFTVEIQAGKPADVALETDPSVKPGQPTATP